MLHVATELSTITQLSPVPCYSYFLPCQRWLAVKEDDGQIARELVPVDRALKSKLSQKDSMAVRNEIALETAGTWQTLFYCSITVTHKTGRVTLLERWPYYRN